MKYRGPDSIAPFYDGLTHLFVTPEDLMPVIARALFAGLHGPRFGRAVLFALPVDPRADFGAVLR